MSDTESILYKMLLIRRVEEEIIARYAKQQMRLPVHLSIGQEAIAVGACHHLRGSDMVFSTHRCHAHYLAKGGSLERMALELHGKVGGCMDGRGGSMHLMDKSVNVMSIPIVASAIPLAVGAALAKKMDGNGNIVVCFFGDAAVEEGVFHESMNFASLMQLPIIFVCENNQYSVDTHISKRQPESHLMNYAESHQIQAQYMGGNDVLHIANVFKNIIDEVREDCKPVFVVLSVNRSHVHCGVDKEFELDNDPMNLVKSYIDIYCKYKRYIDFEVRCRFNQAEEALLPTPEMAKEHVYA